MTSASSSKLLHPLTNDLISVYPSIPYTVPMVSHTPSLIFNISLQAQFQLAAKRAHSFNQTLVSGSAHAQTSIDTSPVRHLTIRSMELPLL